MIDGFVTVGTTRESLRQRCAGCGSELPISASRVQCAECGGLLEIVHPAPTRGGTELRDEWDARLGAHAGEASVAASGVWRFGDVVLPWAHDRVVSHPEGNTPLLERAAIAEWTGIERIAVKHEGHNPTGSFKDRGMTVAVTHARGVGATGMVCASTGNTASSLASYAAHAGIPAVVLVPDGQVAAGKLAQALAYGARTLLVRGDFDDCLRLVREASERLGLYLVNSLNPFRLEGQKTIVLELLQQRRWEVPGWIVLPAGNLGNTAAFGKALRELREWGVIARLPRIAAVQAAGAAPFAKSFEGGFRERHRVVAHTVASAIRIGDPASYERAVRTIRETDGVVLAVSDEEIMEAKAVVDASGVGCEPASAASVAGARALRRSGEIGAGDDVVAVLTGHMLKDPGAITDYHRSAAPGESPPLANHPVEIDATLTALAGALESGARSTR